MKRLFALLFAFGSFVAARSACTEGEIRLNSTDSRAHRLEPLSVAAGRVEVCMRNKWGTVCSTGFGTQEAMVVCRQLGYLTTGSSVELNAAFGEGLGPIQLSSLTCRGTEERLVNCTEAQHPARCTHANDVGVVCQVPNNRCHDGEVQLIGGNTKNKGTVQVCLKGQYGTICGARFNSSAASVICYSLGYSREDAIALPHSFYGTGIGPVQFDSLRCSGAERNITQCLHTSTNTCPQSNDAGVLCKPASAACRDGDVRLVNGTSSSEGRVEVCFNGEWGRVCGTNWSTKDAGVVCRQLGFIPDPTPQRALFGRGSGIALLSRTVCRGNETSLLSCAHAQVGSMECTNSQDATAFCINLHACVNGSVRLLGGASPHEGRVELCVSGQWGTICDQGWNSIAATVVCNQLGFQGTAAASAIAIPNAFYGSGAGHIWFDHIKCRGNETSLLRCTHPPSLSRTCSHSHDAGVLCPDTSGQCCKSGDVRLANGTSRNEGRVEVCVNCVWGTVCDYLWSTKDAQVVCGQLGFSGRALAARGGFFLEGTKVTLLDAVDCYGNESAILRCPRKGHLEIGQNSCVKRSDAGVICQAQNHTSIVCASGAVRLVGAALENAGRVEVCVNNQWSTVCDNQWDSKDAQVVCRQLGYNSSLAVAVLHSQFGPGSGRVLLNNINCSGTEVNIFDCPRGATTIQGCATHHQDAGVICTDVACVQGSIRLANGLSSSNGRLEVCINQKWNTICGRNFGSQEASYVCEHLGFNATGALKINGTSFTPGTGGVSSLTVTCSNKTKNCTQNVQVAPQCSHAEDVVLFCPRKGCREGQVRLAGNNSNEGLVEICFNGQWGTICNNRWTEVAAGVVCQMLGLGRKGSIVRGYRAPTGVPVWLDSVTCSGKESDLLQCSLGLIGGRSCAGSENVAVRCGDCSNGSVRLTGWTGDEGKVVAEGTVELCLNQQWVAVCDQSWGQREATVACRQLGLTAGSAVSLKGSFFVGSATGGARVNCSGSEKGLLNCSHSNSSCGSSELAGVACPVSNRMCRSGNLRLVNGTNQYEGRVELCLGGRWTSVCSQQWGSREASVVCSQLGMAANGYAYGMQFAAFGLGTGPILLEEVNCTGSETALLQCHAHYAGSGNVCQHSGDVSVICPYHGSPCPNGAVRLSGGRFPSEGRLEVCLGGVWGTVCHDERSWSVHNAEVVCKQLGYGPIGALMVPPGAFGAGDGPIQFSHLLCSGTESSLVQCSEQPLFSTLCTHQRDAGVICKVNSTTCQYGSIRLSNGTPHMGRLEVCLGGTFGSVCGENWSTAGASVVCRQLGLSSQGAMSLGSAFFGGGVGLIQLKDVICRGNETSIMECRRQLPGLTDSTCSTHSRDVSVLCTAHSSVCSHGDVKLVGGGSNLEGRVEFCAGGEWTTICSNGWDEREASVVCRQLGHSGDGALAVGGKYFGQGNGTVFAQNLGCLGNESGLASCLKTATVGNSCAHSQDAGVICQAPPCKAGALRLADGTDQYSGRLEVCNGGQWGTVCGKDVSNDLAGTACGLLGFDIKGAYAIGNAVFGRGTGPVYSLVQSCSNPSYTSCTLAVNGAGDQCNHLDDLSLLCTPASVSINCSTGAVKLVGGQTDGRVEVCLGGQWGTVCDDSWTDSSARVVCKQLGLPSDYAVTVPQSSAKFGSVQVPIALSRVKCTGNESSLLNCQLVSIAAASRHYCTHSNDVGVSCPVAATSQSVALPLPSAVADVSAAAAVISDLSSGTKAAITVPIILVVALAATIVVVLIVLLVVCRGKKASRQFKFSENPDNVSIVNKEGGSTEMEGHKESTVL